MGASILLIEEHKGLRDALRYWLKAVFPTCYVREVKGVSQAINLAPSEEAHVILMDGTSAQGDMVQVMHQIKETYSSAEVIVLTTKEYDEYHSDLELAGARACVLTWRITRDLPAIIEPLLQPTTVSN
jgi:DNA-binding NarL/FixJ family response regulator